MKTADIKAKGVFVLSQILEEIEMLKLRVSELEDELGLAKPKPKKEEAPAKAKREVADNLVVRFGVLSGRIAGVSHDVGVPAVGPAFVVRPSTPFVEICSDKLLANQHRVARAIFDLLILDWCRRPIDSNSRR